jgi:hypothetical protein
MSLFISLNKKLKLGPDIIYYLRFFVLKNGRQIFFATANAQLGNLFEKKIEFLGSTDFKKWDLRR